MCQDGAMTDSAARGPQRSEALSRERIVEATIELLDAAGEAELTVRALTAHLATGRGAIYHYVAGKEELLAAATDGIIGGVFDSTADDPDPRQSLRLLTLGIFDAFTEHPWVGTHFGREPMQPAVLRIWTGLGTRLQRLGVTGPASSTAGAALMNYMLGAAAQYAAGASRVPSDGGRNAYLEAFAAKLVQMDPEPITRETAAALRTHDDREQFLAGIDIFLAGIKAAGGRER